MAPCRAPSSAHCFLFLQVYLHRTSHTSLNRCCETRVLVLDVIPHAALLLTLSDRSEYSRSVFRDPLRGSRRDIELLMLNFKERRRATNEELALTLPPPQRRSNDPPSQQLGGNSRPRSTTRIGHLLNVQQGVSTQLFMLEIELCHCYSIFTTSECNNDRSEHPSLLEGY